MNKSFWQKAWPHFAAIGIFLLVAIIYCKPALEGKVLQQSDTQSWKASARQSMEYKEKHGHFPLWTNSSFSGMPAYQIAMGAPYKFIPSVFYLHHVFTLGLPKPINFFFLICLMAYFMLVTLRINPWIGMMGAICYAYSTFNNAVVVAGHDTQMICMAYAPAVLAGLFLLFRRQYLWGTIALVVFAGLIIEQSHLQIVYYTFIIAFFATVAFLIHTIRKGDMKHAFITLGLAAVSAIAALGINIGNIWPVNEFVKETMRGGRSELTDTSGVKNKTSGGLDKDYAFSYSYGRGETFTLLVPGIYGGGSGAKELGSDSKFAEKLVETFRMPEENAVQWTNGSAYWGDQPIQFGTVYLGAVVCFLFVLGMVLLKDWNKWWILAVSVLGIFLAWGSNFKGFNYFLFEHLPYYNKFRVPTMALFMPQLMFPLMGSLTLQQVFFGDTSREELWKKLKLSGIIAGAVLLLLALLYFNFDYSSPNDARLKERFSSGILQSLSQGQQPTAQMQQQAEEVTKSLVNALKDDRRSLFSKDLLRSIVFIGLAFGLLWLYIKDKLKKEYVLAGVILLGVFDLLLVGHRYLNEDQFIDADQEEAAFTPSAADQQIKRDTGYYRVLDETGNPFSDPRASYYHNSIGGYSPAKLGLYQDLIERQISKGNMQVLNMLNAKYFIQQDPSNGQPVARVNEGALGAAWFVKTLVFAKNADDEMHILDKLNTKDSAVIDDRFKADVASQPVYDSAATITLQKNGNDTIVYTTTAQAPQFAVFSEVYYPHGWNAYLDGKKAGYVRVDYLLRGMPVPAGNHTIEFRFEPNSYYTGWSLTLWTNIIILVFVLAGVGFEVLKKKKTLS